MDVTIHQVLSSHGGDEDLRHINNIYLSKQLLI